MNQPADTTHLDDRILWLLFVTVAVLTLVDAVLGRSLFQSAAPALAADAAVLCAVVIARWHLVGAVVLGAGGSIAVSATVETARYRLWHLDFGTDFIVGDGAWPGIAELAGLAVLTTMAVRRRPVSEALIAGAAYGAALLAIAEWRQQGRYTWLFLLLFVVAFAATVATGWYSRSVDRRRADEARAARQDERDAIARELHDLVAHHVTGIVVQAQAARLVAATRPDVATDALSSIEQAGADALRSMRAMVGALRSETGDAPIAPTASIDDIRQLAVSDGVAGLPVALDLDPAADRLPGAVIASLHRITLEALTNAQRHATGATSVDVTIACEPQQVVLTVVNDGDVVTERRQGYGLVGIAERVAALGGHLEAGPRAGGGWTVTATLPTTVMSPRHDHTARPSDPSQPSTPTSSPAFRHPGGGPP